MSVSGQATASFVYNGDGQRAAATLNGVTTVYIGDYFEWEPATGKMTKYYHAGGHRIAMRVLPPGQNAAPLWLFGDHLGSTSVVANTDGSQHSRQGYKAFGEQRYSMGSLPTKHQYTGQVSHETELGLYFYKARFYDPGLMRFIQPDTDVPKKPDGSGLDRYAYASNNPVRYTDPSGHFPVIPILIGLGLAYIGYSVAIDILSVAPVKADLAPEPTTNDMTAWLTDRINENATSPVTQALRDNFTSGNPIAIAGATKAWIALVRTKATWDYKGDILEADITDNDNITLFGEKLNFQAVANIHYGAIGRSAGIPQEVLEMGAGAFQINDNWNNPDAIGSPSTYFDQSFDHWMVGFGGWLYDVYGDEFGNLTAEQLEAAYLEFNEENGDPGQP